MTKERPGEREAERAAFEKWALREFDHAGPVQWDGEWPSLPPHKSMLGHFSRRLLKSQWSAWQARATLSARGGTEGPVAWALVRPGFNGEPIDVRAASPGRRDLDKTAQDFNARNVQHGPYSVVPLYAAPTRARQDALEEAARVLEPEIARLREVMAKQHPDHSSHSSITPVPLMMIHVLTRLAEQIRNIDKHEPRKSWPDRKKGRFHPADGGGRG